MCCAGALAAQEADAPLSAIDWLNRNSEAAILRPAAQVPRTLDEPPTAQSGNVPTVSVAPLDGHTAKRLGLLPYSVTGLPAPLWAATSTDALARPLQSALTQRLPAAQELLITLLLAETDQPLDPNEADRWLIQRIDALFQLGALEPTLSLLQQAGPELNKENFARWLDVSLLMRSDSQPCTALVETPALRPNEAARIYCTARSGDFETAALLYGTASALGVLDDVTDQLLARFLDPELFEEDPMPRASVRPDALTFRLFEAAGSPLPTAPLPVAFAHSDLNDAAGWKAQLEAAERLARAGVLPSNQLLGLYTERKPAASGGIWDRVAALQAFDNALSSGDTAKVAATLPAMWRGMKSAGLEVAFSDLFAKPLTKVDLTGVAAQIAFRMELLSKSYELAKLPGAASQTDAFLMSVAKGSPSDAQSQGIAATSVANGFLDQPSAAIAIDRLGGHLLAVLGDLSDAGRGDHAALTRALIGLRRVGLEDIARRAALQHLILQADL